MQNGAAHIAQGNDELRVENTATEKNNGAVLPSIASGIQRPAPVVRRKSRYERYTMVVMRRLSNPFKASLRRLSITTGSNDKAIAAKSPQEVTTTTTSSNPSPRPTSNANSTTQSSPVLPIQHTPSPTAFAYELEQIQTHVDIASARIRHLQELLDQESPSIQRVTQLKRQLQSTHRELEKVYFQVRSEYGGEMANPVREVVTGVWKAYRAMVRLEARLRGEDDGVGTASRASSIAEAMGEVGKTVLENRRSGSESKRASVIESAQPVVVVETRKPVIVEKQRHYAVVDGQGVYIPTGARDSKVLHHAPKKVVTPIEVGEKTGEDEEETDQDLTEETLRDDVHDASSEALEAIDALPQLVSVRREDNDQRKGRLASSHACESHRHSKGLDELSDEDTHPEQWPQPRRAVIMRVQQEEGNGSLLMRAPNRRRRGSCNGFTITDMVMRAVEDDRFVLPYLHHIKHHEVRVLKGWLVEAGHLHNSGVVSCTEKLLHCIQLLQAGNRYETIAVLFSRTPEQVKASCHEVMAGLMDLYGETVDVDCEHEVYAPLWQLCKKFVLDAQKAEAYYGFRWMDVVQALVALNLYIGRSRGSPSPFQGEPFNWGKFLVPRRSGQLRHSSGKQRERRSSSDDSIDADDSDDSSIYDTPVLQIISR